MKAEKKKKLEAAGWIVGSAREFLDGATPLELAGEQLASLDAVEADAEAAWSVEIARRAADARENSEDEDD